MMRHATNHFEIGIPSLASIILKHDPEEVAPGLNDFVAEDGMIEHPRAPPVFYAFRVIVGTGMAMLMLSWGNIFIIISCT